MVVDSIVRCIHEFQGEVETDLSISPGDIIKITNVLNDEWLEGVLKGKTGQFPKAFVEECHDIFDVGIAIRDFIAEQDDDLSFKEGELVIISEIIDENWMQGYVQGGKHGMFPSAFIKSISFDGTSMEIPVTHHNETKTSVKVLHGFSAHSDNELNLVVGELIEILNDDDDFWCKGRNNEGKEGIFPREYVDLPAKSTSESITPGGAPDVVDVHKVEPVLEQSVDDSKSCLGTAVADFDYASSVEGDLNFMKGDEIKLLKIIDENWYEGELGLNAGLFPSNFVTVLSLQNPKTEHLETETFSTSTPHVEEPKVSEASPEVPDENSLQLEEIPKVTKMKPSRPKLPALKKSGDEAVPFCYQFKTEHQPTVVIPPWKLKPGQQNILLLTKKSLTGNEPESNPSNKTTLQSIDSHRSQFHDSLGGATADFKNTDVKEFQDRMSSYKPDIPSTNKFDRQKFAGYQTKAKAELESLNKNIPNENMSTYQKAKCANNNLNTVVSVANAVGIKTTKTQVAKGAMKMGATTYLTGSAVSKGKPPPSVKPGALKGFGSKGKV